MNRRAELADIEAQLTTNPNRAEWHDADRWDRTTWVRVGNRRLDADRVPHPSDCEDY